MYKCRLSSFDGAKQCPDCKENAKWYDSVSHYIVEWHCAGSCRKKVIEVATDITPIRQPNKWVFKIPMK